MPTTTQGSFQGQRGQGATWGGTSPKQSGTFFPTSSSLQSANDKGIVGPSPLCPRGCPQPGLCWCDFQKPTPPGKQQPRTKQIHLLGPVLPGLSAAWVSPAPGQSWRLEGNARASSLVPTFHVVLLAQLDPAEVGDSPQGDVEGLGHAHLKAVEVHLELGRDRVSCGPGPLPPTPGQASSTLHSWDPESGVGEGSENRQGTAVLQAQAWGWTGGPGADAGLTCRPACRREALGTRTVWHCVSWVSRLVEQASRPCRLSVERGPSGCQTVPAPV